MLTLQQYPMRVVTVAASFWALFSAHPCQSFQLLPVTSSAASPAAFQLCSTLSPTSATATGEREEDDESGRDNDKILATTTQSQRFKVKRKPILAEPDRTRKTMETTKKTSVKKLPYGPLSMTIEELAERLGGRGRARLVWDCYSIGIDPEHFYGTIALGHDDFETIYELLPTSRRTQRVGPAALRQLGSLFPNSNTHCVESGVARVAHISQSRDRTTKLLLELSDGLKVETVIIPWNGVRSTLCISSQVGCRQACRFCATGKMGLQRSLTSDEILAQMFFARKLCRWYHLPPVTNVVFMGMGEPADNAEAVSRAADILTTRELFQLSATKVTVSTVAPTPAAFHDFAQTPCVLAWSVHAARDELRRELVPTTRYKMIDLRQGLIDTLRQRPPNFRTAMLEVVLIDQVNNNPETDGAALVKLARGIVESVPGCKLVVNLIPYNDIEPSTRGIAAPPALKTYRTPPKSSVKGFQKYLWDHGVYAHVRTTRGDDESAACGQLATKNSKTNTAHTGRKTQP